MEKDDLAVIFSHKTDEWSTPQWLFDRLNNIYKFTLDPCASAENTKCSKFYTAQDNGLTKSFANETVFINPPYSQCYEWTKKAFTEALSGTTSVLLVPARMDSKWIHEFCLDPYVCKSLTFIRGRLKFGNSKNSAPFPSMIIEFGLPNKLPKQPQLKVMNNK